GALAAQVAHASTAPLTTQLRKDMSGTIDRVLDEETKAWISGTFTKIILGVEDKGQLSEVMRLLEKQGIAYSRIEESSLGGELTSIGLKPYQKEHIAPLLHGLPLFGSRNITVAVDERVVPMNAITYSPFDLDAPTPNMQQRFTIDISWKHFVKVMGEKYRMRASVLAGQEGSQNTHGLEYLRRNDPVFAQHLLADYRDVILDSLIPHPASSPTISLSSVDGVFYHREKVHLYGGCRSL
ncbi:hypothetical protein HZA99_04400, partial [Candidatus Woesearchaeota archaeon]|nr:hypothetical protein [Candidatus Woesearchaeota archaeon]